LELRSIDKSARYNACILITEFIEHTVKKVIFNYILQIDGKIELKARWKHETILLKYTIK